MRRITHLFAAVSFAALLATALTAASALQSGPALTISFSPDARADAVTGRVYVAISRTNDRPPINQTDPTGVPLFAVNVDLSRPIRP